MKTIKGLIKKDIFNLASYKMSLLILLICMCVMGMASSSMVNYIPIIAITMVGMIALSTFSYDDISKSNTYILSLPTNKKEIVLSKYIFIIAIILGIVSLVKIHNFNDYRRMYKQVLTESNVYIQEKATGTQAMKDTSLKQIELDKNYTSNKSGFAYFHDLFVKRHRKILTTAVKKQSIVILLIIIAMIIGIQMNNDFKVKTNEILLVYLPYFVFIMYCINRSSSVTQAMFMNCDHSMLTYRIYRTPKVILGIFKERLKTLITINLLPAVLMGGGLALLLYLSGGTDNPINYAIQFVSIIAMSIFFSVHYLVMYYLLQPYNVNTEMKSSTYKVVQGLTYIVCWYMIQIQMPIFTFGIATIVFCIAYCLISLFLAYKYAPKTFKLRV